MPGIDMTRNPRQKIAIIVVVSTVILAITTVVVSTALLISAALEPYGKNVPEPAPTPHTYMVCEYVPSNGRLPASTGMRNCQPVTKISGGYYPTTP